MPRKTATPEPPAQRPWSPLLTVDEVAERLRLPRQTLYYWRSEGTGPKARLVGKHLRYREDELGAWLEAQPTMAA